MASIVSPGLLDYIGVDVGLARRLATVKLLQPDLVEPRGCVLLQDRFSSAVFDSWWTRLDGDISRIEEVMNHLHFWDLFDDREGREVEERAVAEMAEAIATAWRWHLADRLPHRSFQVLVSRATEDGYGPTVTFRSADPTDE